MNDPSRSAAREHLARLLFAAKPNIYPSPGKAASRISKTDTRRTRDMVRSGLIGYMPSGSQ